MIVDRIVDRILEPYKSAPHKHWVEDPDLDDVYGSRVKDITVLDIAIDIIEQKVRPYTYHGDPNLQITYIPFPEDRIKELVDKFLEKDIISDDDIFNEIIEIMEEYIHEKV